jgi:hypothetical protein
MAWKWIFRDIIKCLGRSWIKTVRLGNPASRTYGTDLVGTGKIHRMKWKSFHCHVDDDRML